MASRVTAIILIILINTSWNNAFISKPNTLELLFISRITGTEPQIPTDCRLGGQIAADSANNRSDFLADYNVRLSFADEKSLSVNTVKFYMNYTETFRDQASLLASKNVYPSPITVGPWITNGCKAIGSFLHIINYVAIATMCTGTVVTDRKLYPNLFLTLQTNNPKVYGWVRFMKEIGGWKRCALLTFMDNTNDFSASLAFQKAAIDQGIDVVWFDSVVQFDLKTAMSLKNSDARFIMIYINSVPNAVQVHCYSYMAGIRGSRYLFLSLDQSMPNPLNYPEVLLPPGCTRKMIGEQIKYMLHMAMGTDDNINPLQKTDFGYNQPEFESFFNAMKNGTPRSVDYDYRLPCHDATMQALISLDRAEQKLKAQNLSIRDFQNAAYRRKVSDVVYGEVLQSDYRGLHASRVKYDETGSLVNQYTFIAHWAPETMYFRKVFAVQKLDNSPLYDYNSYRVQQVGDYQWLTPDGKPPRDGRLYLKIILEPSLESTIIITVFALLLAVVQFAGLIYNLTKRRRNASMPVVKCIGLAGCILLDASAIVFSLQTVSNPLVLETLRIVLLTTALSLSNGATAFRPITFAWAIKAFARSKSVHNFRDSNRISAVRASNKDLDQVIESEGVVHSSSTSAPVNAGQNLPTGKVIGKDDLIGAESKCFIALAFFVLFHVEMLTAWLLGNGGLTCHSITPREPYYDEVVDTQYQEDVIMCYTQAKHDVQYHENWIIGVAVVQLFFLAFACFAVFDMRQSRRSTACPEFNAIAIGVINATSLLVVSFFILLVLGNAIVAQRIAVAVLSLLISGACSATWFYSAAGGCLTSRVPST